MKWLNRPVCGIALASLCSDIGHEMATTALPLLLSSFGAASAVLGIIEGLADAFSSIAKLLSGLYSDRLAKRKPLAVTGYIVTALSMGSFAFATSSWHVLGARVVGWIGRGARGPVKSVLLTEASVPETRGHVFGFERAMDTTGAIIGPLLAIFLLTHFGIRSIFLVAFLPGFAAALSIWLLAREGPHPASAGKTLAGELRALPEGYKKYLLAVGIAGIGDFSNTLLILWATVAWTPQYGAIEAGKTAMFFYVFYNVVFSISSYVSGVLADRYSKPAVLASGYSLAVVPALALIFPGTSFLKFAVVFGFSGIYKGVWDTLESTMAASMLPSASRGTGFGALATVAGLGDLLSSAIVGTLWTISPTVAMSAVIACTVGGMLLLLRTVRNG